MDGRSPLVVDDPRRLRCEKDAPGSARWVEVIGEGRATLPVWGIYTGSGAQAAEGVEALSEVAGFAWLLLVMILLQAPGALEDRVICPTIRCLCSNLERLT